MINKKIDFVLPWVDGNNAKWLKIREQYAPKKEDKGDSQASARFRDMETLKYVLRSIEQNCPWYNKIYLITKGYYPEWLNVNHPKIELITEEELFIDKSHLPVFSSVAIEMNLSNIKGLSEQFVYLNDDMIIMNKLKPERFFIDSKPVDFLSHGFMARDGLFELLKKRDSWVHSLNNTLELINNKFKPFNLANPYLYHRSYSKLDKISNFLLNNIYKKILWLGHWHHPQPFLKSVIDEVYNEFKDEMMQCSRNRFRDKSDLNQYIYRYWHLAKGNFHPFKHNDALISNLDSMSVLETLMDKIKQNKNINFVCFNDSIHVSDKEYEDIKKALVSYLDTTFSQKASFEN